MGYTHFNGVDAENFKIDGTEVTATAAELNALDGIGADVDELNILEGLTATTAELNLLDGSGAGTATASKAVVLDANKALDEINTAKLSVGASGSEVEVTSTPAEINTLDGVPAAVDYSVGTESEDAITVGIQVNDAAGAALSSLCGLAQYLADDADGDTPTSATPGTVTAGTVGAVVEYVADGAWLLVTDDAGSAELSISNDGAGTWWLATVLPNGLLDLSGTIEFAA